MTHIVIMNQNETIEWSPTMGTQVTSVTGLPLTPRVEHDAEIVSEILALDVNLNPTKLELL